MTREKAKRNADLYNGKIPREKIEQLSFENKEFEKDILNIFNIIDISSNSGLYSCYPSIDKSNYSNGEVRLNKILNYLESIGMAAHYSRTLGNQDQLTVSWK